jgi:molybdopterin-containing oxidoreductase family iron-sulfur binding subunit
VGDVDRPDLLHRAAAPARFACVAENNIPVVGKEQVNRGREMHWIRVDHYFSADRSRNPETYHQPVPCMQCENAPCELVCPVGATTHSSEGLNDMVYNRCVGTRYCSNNCPYKVRRFNFLLYQDWTTPSLEPMRNPDVTVAAAASWRSAPTACSASTTRASTPSARIARSRTASRARLRGACPADAIVFGDMNDPESRRQQAEEVRAQYGLLEDLNTRRGRTYLAALRNPNRSSRRRLPPGLPMINPKHRDVSARPAPRAGPHVSLRSPTRSAALSSPGARPSAGSSSFRSA